MAARAKLDFTTARTASVVGPKMKVQTRLENWTRVSATIRNQAGQFANASGAVQRAHMSMSTLIAAEQHRILRAKVEERASRWPDSNRSSRHLRRAVIDEGNTRGLNHDWRQGFEVGIPDHFDSTPAAPYWRQVEAGTDVFVGRELLRRGRGPNWTGGTGLRDTTNIPDARGPRVTVEQAIEGHRFLQQGAKLGREKLRAGRAFELYRLELGVEGIKLERFRGTTQRARATAAARFLTQ